MFNIELICIKEDTVSVWHYFQHQNKELSHHNTHTADRGTIAPAWCFSRHEVVIHMFYKMPQAEHQHKYMPVPAVPEIFWKVSCL